MIIGNINNFPNNNFINFRSINQSKIKFILKKLSFFSFLFTLISLFTYKLYINNNSIIHMKSLKELYNKKKFLEDDSLKFKRDLDFFNYSNNNYSIEDNLKERMNKEYSFILNLTSNEYIGNWTNLSLSDKNFFDENIENGNAELYFENIEFGYISPLAKSRINSLKINVIIKEGNYIDKYIRLNFTFFIDNTLDKYLDNAETFAIQNINMVVGFSKIKFLIKEKKDVLTKVNTTLKIIRENHIYSPTFKNKNFSPFNKALILIRSKDLNITINAKINHDENLFHNVRLYSFILSFLGIIEIYYCSKLIMKISIHHEIAHKISLLTIIINCCFKLTICTSHFFLSIRPKDEDISYQFGIIAIIYFFNFMGFELKLLFLIFRITNELNRDMYRRRISGLYLISFVVFSLIFFNIKECLTNFYLILIIYTFSWLSQIFISVCKNARPPMSRLYIVWNSLSRLFLPIYFKGYNKNFFELKPSYLKVGLLAFIIFIEAIILILQKSLGARIIIPKKFRKQSQRFDYYKDKVNIEKHVSQNPICVICLENLNVDVDENFNKIKKKKKRKTIGYKIMRLLYLDKLNEVIKKCIKYLEGKNLKKKYMITPCDHVYHTVCLEKWMKQKNECPYCKTAIPPIDG